MFVVAGVSGNTGSVVASALLSQGKKVRVVVRDEGKGAAWKARGAEVAVASFEDAAALASALRGAEGAYLLLPPFGFVDTGIPPQRKALSDALLSAVKAASPGHVVFLSSVGAQHDAGTGPIKYLKPVEAGLAAAGIPSTLLRAAFFQENWGSMIKGALDAGALYYGVRSDLKFSQVATRDIGEVAARMLLDPIGAGARVVELAGPEDLSLQDTAAAMSRVSGKAVQAVTVPVEGMVGALAGMGASGEVAAIYGEMADGINKGLVAWEGGRALSVRGKITLDETLRKALG